MISLNEKVFCDKCRTIIEEDFRVDVKLNKGASESILHNYHLKCYNEIIRDTLPHTDNPEVLK